VSPGSHAADDGSFGRSAGIQAGRAAVLIGAALLVGVILLHRSPSASGGGTPVSIGDLTTQATSRAATPTTHAGATGTTARSSATTTTTMPLRPPQEIKVLVANGTATPGLASKVASTIHGKGYDTLSPTNASTRPPSTVIYFEPSYGNEAAALAGKLNLPASAVQAMPTPPPVPNLDANNTNILVVAGPDQANAGSTTSST
jgi:hypothetical protein